MGMVSADEEEIGGADGMSKQKQEVCWTRGRGKGPGSSTTGGSGSKVQVDQGAPPRRMEQHGRAHEGRRPTAQWTGSTSALEVVAAVCRGAAAVPRGHSDPG